MHGAKSGSERHNTEALAERLEARERADLLVFWAYVCFGATCVRLVIFGADK